MLPTPRVHRLASRWPDHLNLIPPPTNIQAGAAQGQLSLATLRSWRQPDSHSAQHTVNFGPNNNQTAFDSAHSRL